MEVERPVGEPVGAAVSLPKPVLVFFTTSWLNQVERWFARITQDRIRRSAFRSVAELERAIMDYIEENNADPKPFVWTASAELILGKVGAICEQINQSAH